MRDFSKSLRVGNAINRKGEVLGYDGNQKVVVGDRVPNSDGLYFIHYHPSGRTSKASEKTIDEIKKDLRALHNKDEKEFKRLTSQIKI